MREFASFSAEEQAFISRSLDVGLHRRDASRAWTRDRSESAAIRGQHIAYRELAAMRGSIPEPDSLCDVSRFVGTLLRITALDLAQERLSSFSAYRFLYERLLGARVRPWLPAAFCGAAALPQIRPERRKALLQSLSESAATAPGWSLLEPEFLPRRIETETT